MDPYEKEHKLAKNLRLIVEVGIKVSKLYGLSEKFSNKGNPCTMIRYPEKPFRYL
jgi:hypothetical protein